MVAVFLERIGLALVRSIIDLHGGDVIAASEGIGRGSTFTVRLAIADTVTGAVTIEAGSERFRGYAKRPGVDPGGQVTVRVVGGAGNLAVTMWDGGDITFTNIAVGVPVVIRARTILTSGTTATGIIALL